MSYKCKDCGEAPFEESRLRADICVDCMELRGKLITVMPVVPVDEFIKCQKTIANSHGSGRGKKAMLALIAKYSPAPTP